MPTSHTVDMTDSNYDIEIANRDFDNDTCRILIWKNGKCVLDFDANYNAFIELAENILRAVRG